jgi:hypothetical protein
VGAHDGAVRVVDPPGGPPGRLSSLWDGVEETLPGARPLPPVEAAGDGPPGAMALGEIAPSRPGAQNPQDAIDDAPMGVGGMPGLRLVGGEQRAEPLPLGMGQVSSVHSNQYETEGNRVCKHTLA